MVYPSQPLDVSVPPQVLHFWTYGGEAQRDMMMEVYVAPNVTVTQSAVYVCHFTSPTAADPDLCWPPTIGTTTDLAEPHVIGAPGSDPPPKTVPAGAHVVSLDANLQSDPRWAGGQTVGFKVVLETSNGTLHIPTNGDYQRLSIAGSTAHGDPPIALPFVLVALVVVVAVRRRNKG